MQKTICDRCKDEDKQATKVSLYNAQELNEFDLCGACLNTVKRVLANKLTLADEEFLKMTPGATLLEADNNWLRHQVIAAEKKIQERDETIRKLAATSEKYARTICEIKNTLIDNGYPL